MLKPHSTATLFALTLIASLSFADEVDREIHVPAGWEGAYEFGYAPVLKVGDRVIVSGVPNSGTGSYEERTRRMYERVRDLLASAGADLEDVIEITTFHLSPDDANAFRAEFDKYMPIHKEFFGDHRPAWTAVGTSALLSRTADVEMRMEAVTGSGKASRVVFEDPPAEPESEDGASTETSVTGSLIDRYLKALVDFDLDGMSALWTDDIVYADPTAGSRVEGKEKVLTGLRGGMEGISDMRLDVHTRFIANGHAVLMYRGSATMDGVEEPVSADGVIVLRIEDERIAEHLDYVDYGAVQRQMAASSGGG